MNRALAIEFSRVTEAAALAAYTWLGRGDKNAADDAAVKAMRYMLNLIHMDAEIVIGEGEIDEAPMLYVGEKVGSGLGELVSIAVDPIDGTHMTAMGQSNAISVLAAGGKNTFLKAPDMYMEKLVVGSNVKGIIDLNLPLEQNLRRIASKLGKSLSDLTVMVLAKPRHDAVIKQIHNLGAKVLAIPDGDVAGSVLCCLPDAEVDLLYGIGGAPEGVAAAAAIRALGGDMQARLIPRNEVKSDTEENKKIAANEIQRCAALGVKVNEVLKLEDLVRDDNLVFTATGITNGDLLKGISRKGNLASTETILIRGKSRTIRKIQSIHYLDDLYKILNI
ncbi:TPA: class II fructose-bisphosphatase [Haemophilus influenzae]|uniref:Fructose-1,6-bisphosphatase class 2 n=1 Tax=Haemophilus influenzae (strain ATCC 51907 / DSM 11121 / KW20 / Rd) TaxID=71421 RepID=GLPX_HAEIN|nr:class II fructose-bisphosphatase [Haemophilus influenzae]P44811.1 RecName: Full=Fructose-1,6-bisphosphatase class 2; Short=FBPase class 2; AltName: Full=D-fructose-1,6-bisphosphate 1-phosphohydrolase class 2 [Haemophilus influenzae Rd KW20]AAC22322.1 glpX protein (glpX) [Haemophilus influenzae Rd KW20]ARB90230.1 fructose 1,6-bisphosphatase [Haemophilus influenzae]EEW75790.1 fructose-1,6-bisphosphatase, class II [Haemophilus influenzae RdAW]MCK8952674.1 class II fructose-bisphosphatase [Haem